MFLPSDLQLLKTFPNQRVIANSICLRDVSERVSAEVSAIECRRLLDGDARLLDYLGPFLTSARMFAFHGFYRAFARCLAGLQQPRAKIGIGSRGNQLPPEDLHDIGRNPLVGAASACQLDTTKIRLSLA
jgi:hypothetical protein